MLVHFVVIAPESKQGTFAVRLPVVVGRSEEAKFRIQQDRVSRKHCEFIAQDGAVFIRDLGSTNGTFLDDQPVEAGSKTPCPAGAVVRVGGLAFRVDYDVPLSMRSTQIRPLPPEAADLTVGAQAAGEPGPLEVEHAAEPVEHAAEPVEQGGDDEQPAWPAVDDAADAGPADDEQLGDFFKGLK